MNICKEIPTIADIKSMTSATHIFFDMDGTLVNTESLHAEALEETLKEISYSNQLTPEELKTKFHGQADDAVYKFLNDSIKISFDEFLNIKNKHFINIIRESKKITDIKIIKLLEDLKDNHYKISLITASEKSAAIFLLKKENLESYFSIILTREDSITTKPSPQPYLDALEKLKIVCDDAFIFEDSITGIQSATASGIDYAVAKWFN